MWSATQHGRRPHQNSSPWNSRRPRTASKLKIEARSRTSTRSCCESTSARRFFQVLEAFRTARRSRNIIRRCQTCSLSIRKALLIIFVDALWQGWLGLSNRALRNSKTGGLWVVSDWVLSYTNTINTIIPVNYVSYKLWVMLVDLYTRTFKMLR